MANRPAQAGACLLIAAIPDETTRHVCCIHQDDGRRYLT